MVAALAAAVIAGCGGGGGASEAEIARFVGTWQWDMGMLSADCGGAVPPFNQDLSGQTLTLVKGTGSEVILTLGAMCQITFTVGGTSATANPNQSCTLMVQMTNQSVAVSSWKMTTTDGANMSTDMKGTALAGLCMVSGSGTLSKQP